ncbi:MAG: hypothetical protein ACKVPY_16055 [Paracoccaceae bacterium]
MKELRNALGPQIPLSAKVFGWLLVAAGFYFFYVFTQIPGSFFPGVGIETYSERFGLYSTGARVLGSVAGLMIALWLDSAALLALMLATRIFIEIGDILVGLILNQASDANTYALSVTAGIETVFLIILLRVLIRAGRMS